MRILFLSRLHEKKNVPVLLRALASASRNAAIELTIAGDGDARYRDDLVSLTRGLGVADRVRFVGHVEGDAKRTLFERADCFVLPSAHENFGLAVAEALAAALPVIVTPGVALASMVTAAGAGLVADATEGGVASALTWVATHAAELPAIGQRGWRLARRDLSWDASCSRLIALYTDVTSRTRREGRPA